MTPSTGEQHLSFPERAIVGCLAILLLAPPSSAQDAVLRPRVIVAASSNSYTGTGDLAPLPNGGIVAAYPREHLVRVFDSNGNLTAEIGRNGEGPGEFRQVTSLGSVGQSIWVSDRAAARVQVFTAGGNLERQSLVPTALRLGAGTDPGADLSPGRLLAVRPDGVLRIEGRVRGAGARLVVMEVQAPIAAGTNPGVELFSGDPDRCRKQVAIAGQPGSMQLPFCTSDLIGVSADGGTVVRARATEGASSRVCVAWVTRAGLEPVEHCHPFTTRRIDQRELDSARAAMVRLAPTPEFKAAAANLTDLPSRLPPFRRLIAGNDGSAWLESWDRGTGRQLQQYLVNGRMGPRVLVPGNMTVQAADARRFVGVVVSADGLEDLVEVRLP